MRSSPRSTPVLTPEDAATLSSFAAEPIPIEYVLSFDGQAAVEPVTGAEVRVSVSESVGASPVLTSLPALQDVLSHYPGVPEAVTASAALDDLAAAPASPLFEYSYEQTPPSVADVADTVTDMRRQVLLAKVWLPLALAAGAVAEPGRGRRRVPAAPPAADRHDGTGGAAPGSPSRQGGARHRHRRKGHTMTTDDAHPTQRSAAGPDLAPLRRQCPPARAGHALGRARAGPARGCLPRGRRVRRRHRAGLLRAGPGSGQGPHRQRCGTR